MPLGRGRRSVQDGIPTQERGNEIGLEFREAIFGLSPRIFVGQDLSFGGAGGPAVRPPTTIDINYCAIH
jgi:hypothetical protein